MMNAHRITGIRGTAAGGLLAAESIVVAGLLEPGAKVEIEGTAVIPAR